MSKVSGKKKAPKKASGKKTKGKAAAPLALPAPGTEQALPVSFTGTDRPGIATALDQARAQWEHGDWAALLALDTPALGSDPERAKLALLIAAAHSHIGEMDRARHLARQALDWGVSRNMAARVLLSAAQNSVGRVAAALEEEAAPHFEAAIRLVQPHADAPLLARSRRVRELASLGLLPQAAKALEQELGVVRAETVAVDPASLTHLEGQLGLLRKVIAATRPTSGQASVAQTSAPKFNPRALDVYTSLDPARAKRFLYLDVKSLPRTGLHFMRNTFESLLRDHFSFCEWYNEPGCCGQMPCAVTGYATEVPDVPMLRMIKSHDFDLTDPAFPTTRPIQRLILLRDPLYLLTSWWTLHVLYLHPVLLKKRGIVTNKISFEHRPHVVRAAYGLIDAEGTMPPAATLLSWLEQKTPYILGFVEKWAKVAQEHPQQCRIVRYDETPEAILDILTLLESCLSPEVQARIDTFRTNRDTLFKARQDPFHSQSRRIREFLLAEADRFRDAAERLCRQDRTGLLASC